MRPELERKLERIRRSSQVLRRVCQGLLILFSLLLVICVAGILAGGDNTVTAFDSSLSMRSLLLHQRIFVAMAAALMIAVPLKGLRHLERLFRDYAHGDIFTTESASQIRQLGVTALLWAAANVAWLVITFTFAGRRPLHAIYLRADSIVIGVTVVVISWFMELAAEMREENELTI